MQPEQQALSGSTEATDVIQFLTSNPEFFNQHSEVLAKLRIPHHTGDAVSLIEKQLSVLRRQCSSLENKLTELISVARENEKLHQRMHLLIQEVISAPSLDDVISLTRESLIENFHADELKIVLIDDKGDNNHEIEPERYVAYDEPRLNLFEKHFTSRETLCGVPGDEMKTFLFGDNGNRVGSVAVIPLHHGRSLGLAVLSSRDDSRFDSDKGVMFLNQLGEVLSRRISAFM